MLQEIVEQFGVVQSKGTTVMYLLLSNKLGDDDSDSKVSVQRDFHHAPRLAISHIHRILFPRFPRC